MLMEIMFDDLFGMDEEDEGRCWSETRLTIPSHDRSGCLFCGPSSCACQVFFSCFRDHYEHFCILGG